MDKPIELVPLVCIQCSTAIPTKTDEVAWACGQCGQGMTLDETHGLEALDIHYSADILPNRSGRPFWVADGRVKMERSTYGSAGKHGKAAAQFWSQTRRFFVPAYQAPLESLLETAKMMLLNPPSMRPGEVTTFEAVTLFRTDVDAAAEFIVMAIEAERKDKLKSINFELQLSKPVLWILP